MYSICKHLPTPKKLRALLKKLGLEARDLLRKSESAYKENNLQDQTLKNEQLIQAMVEHPILIERPIVEKGNKAVLGRPPENVLSLI